MKTLFHATGAQKRHSPSRLVALAILILTCVAAFALRVQDLGAQSLWFDEAMSVVLASKSPPEMIALLVTEDIHPPLYPILLHFWMLVAGDGEFAVRFLSVIAGVAIVPLMYVTGRLLARLAGAESPDSASVMGLVAAILSASSAFYVGYSQEARNYMLVTVLGLLSSYLLLRALPSRARRPWILYAVATGAALYSNYTAFLLLVFQALFVLLVRRSFPGATRHWLKCLGALALAYAPWTAYMVSQLERINDYWPGTLIVGTAVKSTLAELVAGGGANVPATIAPMLFALLLLALGAVVLVAGSRRRHSHHSLFLLLYLVVPTAILFAIAYSRPKFDPRYLLVATPAFYLTLAWGMASLLRAARSRLPLAVRIILPAVGVLALLGTVAISTIYGEPTKVKADYRDLVAYIEDHAQPGDAVVLLMNAPHPYIYYSTKGIPWYPMERVDDFQGAITRLNKMREEHRRLWFILWQQEWEDPAGYVLHIMETQSTEVKLDASFTGLGLRLFELSPNRPFTYYPTVQYSSDAVFGGSLEYWGSNSSPASVVTAGDTLEMDLHWIPHVKPQTDLKEVLTLVDADQHVWARTDEVMCNPLYPPTKWKVGDIVHDTHDLQLPPGAPPGDYSLELTLYDPATLKELPIATSKGAPIGTVLTIGKIAVQRGPVSASSQPPAATWTLGGNTLDLAGFQVGQNEAVPGESIEVTLRWRSPQQVQTDYSVRLAVLDSKGQPLGEQTLPMSSAYPSSKWRAGEEIMAKYWLPLPVDLEKGRYYVAVAPVAGQATNVLPIQYAQLSFVDVVTPKVTYDVPPVQHTVGARFGGLAELVGYDLSGTRAKPGDTLHLTLYWRTLGHFDRSYKVFNHVIDDANVFAGQRDSIPVGDSRPTTTWRMGEVLVDKYDIPIAPNAKPGSYHLKVGMYAQEGGERLQVAAEDGTPRGDSVTLTDVEVTP